VVLANDGGGAISYNIDSPQRVWTDEDYPTEQFYHVITPRHVPFHVCGAQQDNSTLCVPSAPAGRGGGGGGGNPDVVVSGRRRRTRLHRTRSERHQRLLRRREQRIVLTRFNRMTGEIKEVGAYPRFFSGENSASVVERWQWTVSDHLFTRRPQRPLHLLAARLEVDQRRRQLGADQRRPHASRSEDDAGFGRADHARHEQPGNLRDGVFAGARPHRTSTSSGRAPTTA
jgi:hypothetical protein